MENTIIAVATAVVSVIALIIARYVIPYLKKNIDAKHYEDGLFWATHAVRWAQDWLQSNTGEERRKNVMSVLHTINEDKHLGLTDEMIDVLVRASYTVMMEEMAKSYGTEE